jgi:hypothetical protein
VADDIAHVERARFTPEQRRILDGDWTPGERRLLEEEAAEHGWEWTRANAWRLLDEARSILGEDLEHE